MLIFCQNLIDHYINNLFDCSTSSLIVRIKIKKKGEFTQVYIQN